MNKYIYSITLYPGKSSNNSVIFFILSIQILSISSIIIQSKPLSNFLPGEQQKEVLNISDSKDKQSPYNISVS